MAMMSSRKMLDRAEHYGYHVLEVVLLMSFRTAIVDLKIMARKRLMA